MNEKPEGAIDQVAQQTEQFLEHLYREFLHSMVTQDKSARKLFKETVRPLIIQFNERFVCPMHKSEGSVRPCSIPGIEKNCGNIPCIMVRPKE
jgi:hypothetical protein